MLLLELNREHMSILEEFDKEFPMSEKVEISSFGADTVIQVLIPLAAILAPVVSPVIIKLVEDKRVTAKFDGIELSGDYRKVQTLIKDIQSFRADTASASAE